MHICVCVYIYPYIWVGVCIYIYIYIYIYISVSVYIYIYVCVCVCVCMCVCSGTISPYLIEEESMFMIFKLYAADVLLESPFFSMHLNKLFLIIRVNQDESHNCMKLRNYRSHSFITLVKLIVKKELFYLRNM